MLFGVVIYHFVFYGCSDAISLYHIAPREASPANSSRQHYTSTITVLPFNALLIDDGGWRYTGASVSRGAYGEPGDAVYASPETAASLQREFLSKFKELSGDEPVVGRKGGQDHSPIHSSTSFWQAREKECLLIIAFSVLLLLVHH